MTLARLAFLAALAFAAPALAAPLTVKTIKIEKHNKRTDLEFTCPQTGVKSIDTDLAAWAKAMKKEFEGYDHPAGLPSATGAYSADLSFDVARNDNAMFAVVFNYDTFAGGAHPNHELYAFNYLRKDGARVDFAEIFGMAGTRRVSQLAIADLIAQGVVDDDWVRRGAGPAPENFSAFVLHPKALEIFFPPYQVAPYAAGAQTVSIPLARLKDVMRGDWRAPQPSFDCLSAKAPIEVALCGDAGLARLDRDMAAAFRTQRANAYEDGAKEKLLREQKAWLTRRDACLKGVVPPAACLTGLYKARIAILKKL